MGGIMNLIEKIGVKFFSKDGTIELPPHEAKKDAGTFILAMMSAIIASIFLNNSGTMIVGVCVYIFFRFKQRGPYSDF